MVFVQSATSCVLLLFLSVRMLTAQSTDWVSACRDYTPLADRTNLSSSRAVSAAPSDVRWFLRLVLRCSRAPGADLARAWRALPESSETMRQLLSMSNEISSADLARALAELASTPAEGDSVRLYALTALAGQAYPYAAYPTAMSFVQRARRDAAVGGFTHSRGVGAAGDWPAPARRVVAERLVALRAGDPIQDVRAAASYVARHMELDSLMRTPEAQRYKPKP